MPLIPLNVVLTDKKNKNPVNEAIFTLK